MTIASIIPVVTAAAPVAAKAIGALDRLTDKISFRSLLAGDSEPLAQAPLAQLQTALDRVGELLANKLSQLGVAWQETLEFESDGAGGARVSNPHFQASQIDAMLASSPDLSREVGDLLKQVSGLRLERGRLSPVAP
jgi:hypothetical protein